MAAEKSKPSGISVTVDGKKQTDPLDITIRKTYAQTVALFIVVKNLQVEVQELRAEQKATRAVLLALVGDPQVRHEAEAVIRDLLAQKKK